MNYLEIKPVQNTQEDIKLLCRFMHELAAFDDYEAHITPEKLRHQLFTQTKATHAALAFYKGEPIGFVVFYECFTVYHGEAGLYINGAYVIEKYRHKGFGVKLFAYVAQYALQHKYSFVNWIVEHDNKTANAIYQKLGADMSPGWNYVRLDKAKMQGLMQKYKLS